MLTFRFVESSSEWSLCAVFWKTEFLGFFQFTQDNRLNCKNLVLEYLLFLKTWKPFYHNCTYFYVIYQENNRLESLYITFLHTESPFMCLYQLIHQYLSEHKTIFFLHTKYVVGSTMTAITKCAVVLSMLYGYAKTEVLGSDWRPRVDINVSVIFFLFSLSWLQTHLLISLLLK